MKKVRYIDLPKGARFKHNLEDTDVWVVLEQHDKGKIALEHAVGIPTHLQSICCVTEYGQSLKDVEVYAYPAGLLADLAEAAKAVRQAYIELADLDFGVGSIGNMEGDLAVVKLNDLLKEYGL